MPQIPNTGGKRWCPGSVHHKDITRTWTKYWANTHPGHPKYIQNIPSQFPCSFPRSGNGQYIHSVPDHVIRVSPSGTSWENSKCAKGCVHDVPEWLIQNVLWNFPSSGIMMFPVSKTENEPERCPRNDPEWEIQNVLEIPHPVYFFRNFSEFFRNTSGTLQIHLREIGKPSTF